MYKPSQIFAILRQYGWPWVIYRIKIAIEHGLGLEQRRMPIRNWGSDQTVLDQLPTEPLLPSPAKGVINDFISSHSETVQDLRREADEILQGKFRKFEGESRFLGFPPLWNEELPGRSHPSLGIHWSQIQPFEDIKLVWELSRMGWAQVLARAYAFTGSEAYAEAFWTLLESWHITNPPNQGPQWMCGQEIAIRSIALAIADSLLRNSPSSTPLRRARLQEIIQVGAERIEPHFHYARSQRNNHALNEALGLMTAAVLTPIAMTRGGNWLNIGGTSFDKDLLDQLDEEGSYIQHSTTYHRVMIHACTWRLLLAKVQGKPLSKEVQGRMKTGLQWMVTMVDPSTGRAPNLGSNDGANVLRISTCPYLDHRPSLQGIAALLEQPLPYPPGPWDEPVLWLLGQDPNLLLRKLMPAEDMTASARGHYLRPFEDGSLYFRCASYQERPSQSDPLHVDLTWRGINILCDAGTYRYNAPAPWSNALAHVGVHNTITINGQASMGRMGPFLWLDWDSAFLRQDAPSGWLVGERRPTRFSPMKHRRSISLIGPKHWVILDEVEAPQQEAFRLHWLLPNLAWSATNRSVQLNTPRGTFQLLVLGPGELNVSVGDPNALSSEGIFPPVGWRSVCYFQLEPALAVTCVSTPSVTARWISVAGEGPFDVSLDQNEITIDSFNNRLTCKFPMLLNQEI